MKPSSFKYLAPGTIEEALAIMAAHGYEAKALAGGQSLIPMMNFRLAQPAVMVDLNNLPELAYIRPEQGGGLRMGAMTRQSAIEHSAIILERAPMLHATMPNIAYSQIRNRGTLGGSIAHADPSAELPAVSVALDGRFRIRSHRKERWVPANAFFVGLFTTVLEPDELLVEVELPPMPRRCGWAFTEVARRHHDFALVGAAAAVTVDARGACEQTRLVLFSVGDGPVEAHQAAKMLAGQPPTLEAIRAAAETAARDDVDPGTDINATAEFRRHLVRVLSGRVLTQAFGRAHAQNSSFPA